MESLLQLYSQSVDSYGLWGLSMMALLLLLFMVQLYIYIARYGRISNYRNTRRAERQSDQNTAISVVVLIRDDYFWYLDESLQKLLSQDYEQFEVVLVEIGTSDEFSDRVAELKRNYEKLNSTKINQTARFPISDKMAYNVGIKAAQYENIVLTTTYAEPVSEKWLSFMAKGFENGDVVLGYCGLERRKGFVYKLMRSSRLMLSVRYLSAAIRRRPYRGIIHNIGFTRRIYFENSGFSHLNMNVGEDDLFIQRIATSENTSIVVNPHATLREQRFGGFSLWWYGRKFDHASYRYYKTGAKRRLSYELLSRTLFYTLVVLLVVTMPFHVAIGAGSLWFIRLVVVRYQMWTVRRRLGEAWLGWALTFYDIIEPVCELLLWLSIRLRPGKGIWR